jgi:hypothetical protein
MTDKDERSDFDFGDITAPYFFRPLWEKYRNILRFIGETPKESITGMELFRFTHDHDTLRTIVAWNFLTPIRETELREYDQVLSTTDWELRYKITRQAREFAALETNNISDLYRAILILLRAVVGGETRAGFDRLTLLPMGFLPTRRTAQQVGARSNDSARRAQENGVGGGESRFEREWHRLGLWHQNNNYIVRHLIPRTERHLLYDTQ